MSSPLFNLYIEAGEPNGKLGDIDDEVVYQWADDIISRLPKTKDGVPVVAFKDKVWYKCEETGDVLEGYIGEFNEFYFEGGTLYINSNGDRKVKSTDCYSTKEKSLEGNKMNYTDETGRIPLTECKKRHLYKIDSRNLTYGVFDGDGGFIGIREKFGLRYLFTEFHWDTGAPFGTVSPREDLGEIPKGLLLKEELGTRDEITGKLIKFDKKNTKWIFAKGGKVCEPCRAVSISNKPLFDYLVEAPLP